MTWCRVIDVAKEMAVTPRIVRDWITQGSLDAINISQGRGTAARYRIPRESLDRFVQERRTCEESAADDR